MKCQNCDGNGRFEVEDNGVVMQGVYWRCPTCGGKGIVEPLTNEEWLKSLDTKELAKWLRRKTHGNDEYNEEVETAWEGWLKAKHIETHWLFSRNIGE